MMNNHSPYEIHNGQIGVRLSYVVADGDKKREESLALISYDAYKWRSVRNPGFRLKQGRGAGNEALIKWVELPHDWREKCRKAFGDPELDAVPTLLEKNYQRDPKAADFYANWKRPDDRNLEYKHIVEYTTNASMLNAIIATMANRKALRKALGGSTAGLWETIYNEVEVLRAKTQHTLKVPSLQRTLSKYRKEGYEGLISGKLGNRNTAKIQTVEQQATIEELLNNHNNLDNEQITSLYNTMADKLGWKRISPSTVANIRTQTGLYIDAGRRGESVIRNKRAMLVKRKRPSQPLYYWTLDGWDVELFYQKNTTNAKGHNIVSYNNRLTAVVVLDPCVNYPIGYAIGTHETPELIREAMRNAVNHTRELFGERHKPWQLQSDHYGKGTLTPLYEALSEYYTPARVKNAKAKVIEPWFKKLNKSLQYQPNWSGYGVTVNPDKQPNAEYLNKIRHSFPDETGCRLQIMHALEMKRMEVRDEYLAKWADTPEGEKRVLTTEEYLNLFGATTGFTNRLHHYGLQVTIGGEELVFDSFEHRFRELSHIAWCVKYDPEDLSQVLVVDAESAGNKLIKELNTVRFVLERKHVQPMALKERTDGDAGQLARLERFNDELIDTIIDRRAHNGTIVRELFAGKPELEGTDAKLVLVDSQGQYKDNKNQARLEAKAKQLQAKEDARAKRLEERQELADREAYIDQKIDIEEYL